MKFLDHLNDAVKEVKGVVKEKAGVVKDMTADAAKEIKEKVTENKSLKRTGRA